VSTKNFSLSYEDAEDKDDWRQALKGQLANPGSPGKCMCACVCVCVCMRVFVYVW